MGESHARSGHRPTNTSAGDAAADNAAAGDAAAGDAAPDDHERTGRSALFEAAIEAELATGGAEETEAQARASVIRRLARITTGFVVLLLGLAAVPLPGPGWLIVAAGLVILSRDFVWAERTLGIVRRRIPTGADGKIATRTWVIMGTAMAGGIGLSLWWTLWR